MLALVLLSFLRWTYLVQSQPLSACENSCNLALCLDSSDSVSNEDYKFMEQAVKKITTITSASTEQTYNLGFSIYAGDISPQRTCYMYPKKTKQQFDTCTSAAFDPTIRNRESTHLELCFNLLNTHAQFWKNAYAQCKYRVVVLTDGNTSDMPATAQMSALLRAKGVEIVCYTLGHDDDYDFRQEYDRICDTVHRVETAEDFRDGIDNMIRNLSCLPDVVTTTTTVPTTTVVTTPAPVVTTPGPPGPCTGCKISNGVGYNPHQMRCDCWMRCIFKTGGSVHSFENCCGCGQFWDQDLLTCVVASDKKCPHDRCSPISVRSYAFAGNCRARWVCNGNRTETTECCTSSQRYDPSSQTCIPDTGNVCKDDCPCDTKTTGVPVCTFKSNPRDPHTYYVPEFAGQPLTLMTCARGTNYDAASCKCLSVSIDEEPECPPDFDLRCSETPLLDHGGNAYIANYKVSVNAAIKRCSFNGQARLMVPRYSNMDWAHVFAIFAEFNGETNPNNGKPVLSNTDCDEPASLEIRLSRGQDNAPVVEARITTTDGVFVVSLPYKVSQKNKVYMSHDGETLRLTIKYEDGSVLTKTIKTTGQPLRCHCALQIGYGWKNRYFSGRMYNVRLYIYCIPKNFHPTA